MVSACLLGIGCRYDGRHSFCPGLVEALPPPLFLPFCPEQLGGLPTPRPPAELKNGDGQDILAGVARVMNAEGKDVTEAFKRGANEALRLARFMGILVAVMKDGSPSCGLQPACCEKPMGRGLGVTAALFASEGITMIESGSDDGFSSQELRELIKRVYK
jgi:uncharacterized protein YbbK (DUF523 family)